MGSPIKRSAYVRYDDEIPILEANRREKPEFGCNITRFLCLTLAVVVYSVFLIGTTAAAFLKESGITKSAPEPGDSKFMSVVKKSQGEPKNSHGMGGSKNSKGKSSKAECDDNIPALVYCFDIFANGSNIPYPCPANYTFKTDCTDICQSNIQRDGKDGVVDLCPVNENNTAACCFKSGRCADFDASVCNAKGLVLLDDVTCAAANCTSAECCCGDVEAANIPALVYCFDIFANGSNIPYPCPANYTFKTDCTDTCQSNIQCNNKVGVVDLCPVNENNTAACCFKSGRCADFDASVCNAKGLVLLDDVTCAAANCTSAECCCGDVEAANIPALVYCFDIFANGSNIPYPCPANYTFKTDCTDTCQSNIQCNNKVGVVDLCPVNENNTAACCFESGRCADFNASICNALGLIVLTNVTCAATSCTSAECCGLPCVLFNSNDALTVGSASYTTNFTGVDGTFWNGTNFNHREACQSNMPFSLTNGWRCLKCEVCPGIPQSDTCSGISATCNVNPNIAPGYDVGLVNNKLRISNYRSSGSFTDHLHSPFITVNGVVGEQTCQIATTFGAPAPAYWGTSTNGTYRIYNSFQFTFDVGVYNNDATNLTIGVTPTDGQGGRQGQLALRGISANTYQLVWQDVSATGTFQDNVVATRPASATTKVTVQIWFVDGLDNDVARVFIDGRLAYCGTTWENFYIKNPYGGNKPVVCVRDLAFLSRATSSPAAPRGSGFLIDNLQIVAGLQDPTDPDLANQCCPLTRGKPQAAFSV
eukprot:g21028.t1